MKKFQDMCLNSSSLQIYFIDIMNKLIPTEPILVQKITDCYCIESFHKTWSISKVYCVHMANIF